MRGLGQFNLGSTKLDETIILVIVWFHVQRLLSIMVKAFEKIRQSQKRHSSAALGRNLSPSPLYPLKSLHSAGQSVLWESSHHDCYKFFRCVKMVITSHWETPLGRENPQEI